MAALDLVLGPILLGTAFNIWLYGIMVTQTTVYYATFSRDRVWIKALVAYIFILATLNGIFNIGFVWRYTITLFGDFQRLGRFHWFLNIGPVTTSIIATLTQGFFAWRITKLTGQTWLGWLIGVLALVQFGAGVGSTIGAFIVKDLARLQGLRPAVIVWLGASVVTNLLITGVLNWYLHTHRTGFPKTDAVILRVLRLTVQTGLVTTAWVTVDLILYLFVHNNLHIFFQLSLCGLYTNFLLSNLNSRVGWGESHSYDGNDPGAGNSTNHCARVSISSPDQLKSIQRTTSGADPSPTSRRGSKVEFVECNVDRPRRVTSEIVEVPGPSTSRPGAVVRFSGHWDHNSRRGSNQLASQPAREELV